MIKKIFVTLFVLIVLLLVAISIFLATFDLNHYRVFTQAKLSKILNYPVQIGSMKTKLSLVPTIEIQNVKIFQNGENPQVILSIPKLDAVVELLPLLHKKIEIRRIDVLLVSADLTLLQTSTKNTSSGNDSTTMNTNDSATILNALWVREITIEKLLLRFMNQNQKDSVEASKISIQELNKLKFQLTYKNRIFDIDGSAGLLTKFLSDFKELPIDFKVRQGGALATLRGQIGDVKKLSNVRIDANINIPKMRSFLRSWKIDLPSFMDVPTKIHLFADGNMQIMALKNVSLAINRNDFKFTADGTLSQLKQNPSASLTASAVLNDSNVSKNLYIKPFEFKSNIDLNKDRISLKKIDFQAGRSDIKGNFDVEWRNQLTLYPNLTSSYLDIEDIIIETTQNKIIPPVKQAQKDQNYLISNQKLNWHFLKYFDLKGKVDIKHLFLTDQISNYIAISMLPDLKNGVLSLPYTGQFLDGAIKGDLKLNVNKKTVNLTFRGQSLNLNNVRQLSKAVRNVKLNTDISLSSNGDTPKAIISSSNGKIIAEILGGTITDKWFNSLPSAISMAKSKAGLLDFSTSDQRTEITCGAINVPVANGIITSDKQIVLQTSALNFEVSGQTNLQNETVNLTVIPSINQTRGMANQLLSGVQAVHLKGGWQDIQPSIDVGQTVDNIAKTAIEKLSGQKPQVISSKQLCQKVLGNNSFTQTANATQQKKVQQTNKKEEQDQKTSKKEDFRQQLIQSLNQAIQQRIKK